MVWAGLAGSGSRPRELTAEEGWRRWPLLWERSGGDPHGPRTVAGGMDEERAYASRPLEVPRGIRMRDAGSIARAGGGLFGAMDDEEEQQHMSSIPLHASPKLTTTQAKPLSPPPTVPTESARLVEESSWPSTSFMPTAPRSTALQVNRLGSLMRDLEEEREMQDVIAARRRERRDLTDGERDEAFVPVDMADEREVIETFERVLLELFLDGKDVRFPIKAQKM